MEILYLSRQDVQRVNLPMADSIGLLEIAFREKGEGRVEMPPKLGIHPAGDAFIHAMPCHIPALKAAGVKWVGGFPRNQDIGLPYITGNLGTGYNFFLGCRQLLNAAGYDLSQNSACQASPQPV